jgi:hypothetical protein
VVAPLVEICGDPESTYNSGGSRVCFQVDPLVCSGVDDPYADSQVFVSAVEIWAFSWLYFHLIAAWTSYMELSSN